MNSDDAHSPRKVASRYFEMWNTGDSSIAHEILSPDWVDHAHPEVTGPHSVRQSVEQTRVASRTCGSRSTPSSATVTW